MAGVLPYLNQTIPVMRSKIFLTIRTLGIFLDKLDDLALLDFGGFVDSSDKLNFNFHSFGVRLCPHKFGVLKF